jgi:hypothetical protein
MSVLGSLRYLGGARTVYDYDIGAPEQAMPLARGANIDRTAHDENRCENIR